MQNQNYKEAIDNDIFSIITKASELLEVKSYVIGGFVRDYILQKGAPKDIDIVTVGNGITLAKKVASLLPNTPKVQVFKTYGTAMLVYKDMELEFVGARKESYTEDSRNPEVSSGTLEDDQKRRDFTINAIYLDIDGNIFDPQNGKADLKNKIVIDKKINILISKILLNLNFPNISKNFILRIYY